MYQYNELGLKPFFFHLQCYCNDSARIMDPTPLQQTVMESQEVTSPPQEVDPSAPTPSDPSSITNADQAYEPLSYDEVCKEVSHLCMLCNCCSYCHHIRWYGMGD